MSESRFALVTKIATRTLVCVILLIWANHALCDTDDDDTTLEFYWDAASGKVDHYNVYLSVDGGEYSLIGSAATSAAPTAENPYVVSDVEDGKKYQLKVEAEDATGATGPMSEMSDPVWCKLRSPGDTGGSIVGDADGDLRVGVEDWQIFCKAWNTQRGDASFDYRADFNYDNSVSLLDLIIMASNWGNIYSDGS